MDDYQYPLMDHTRMEPPTDGTPCPRSLEAFFMRKTLRYLLPILLLGFLSGCSVFGIATKGDLKRQNEELSQNMADQQAATNDQLANVAGRMEAMNTELNTAMADLDSRHEATASELADVRVHFEMIQGQLQLALADLESVADVATRAEAGSRHAIQMQQDAVTAERERLRERLQDLDNQISSWYPAAVPGDQLQRVLRPELQSAPIQSAASSGASSKPQSRPGLQIPESARRDR